MRFGFILFLLILFCFYATIKPVWMAKYSPLAYSFILNHPFLLIFYIWREL